MKMTNRKAAFTALILLSGVLLCLGGLIYHTKATKLRALSQTRNTKREELRGLQGKLASRKALERKYLQLQERLAVLEPALPTYAYVPTFLRQIEKLAHDSDNKVAGVKPLPLIERTPAPPAGDNGEAEAPQPVAAELYDRVPIEFNLTGKYWQTVDFLERMSAFPKMLAVEDVSLTPAAQPEGLRAPCLRVKMNLLALIQKGEEKWTSDEKNSSS